MLPNDLWLPLKTLWSRFKRQSNLLEQGQTLYSFRHSGAIEIFKRTGSITKLQKAMGHSSINVSLTYLRGLELPELNEEDMPKVSNNKKASHFCEALSEPCRIRTCDRLLRREVLYPLNSLVYKYLHTIYSLICQMSAK